MVEAEGTRASTSAGWSIRAMTLEDYDRVYALWETCAGLGLSAADSRAGIAALLGRNPGMSFVAVSGRDIVGSALCGHDGRRGYIHHLAVSTTCRHQGIARALLDRCLNALANCGIDKCHAFVYADNEEGARFWLHVGAARRVELELFSVYTPRCDPEADKPTLNAREHPGPSTLP
ncbi:MAG: GNAT family N-acetyltransferase [Candidatus Latescibacterota bacterium]|nr:MAG: GNAT family N-acetyltransferase [Candidatus Latescibacterota bacterium]